MLTRWKVVGFEESPLDNGANSWNVFCSVTSGCTQFSVSYSDLYLNGVLLVCQNWIYKMNFEKVAIIFNRAITSSEQRSCMLLRELIFMYVLKNKIYTVEVYGLQQKFVFVFRVYGKEDLS